jgi:hypothetical protein
MVSVADLAATLQPLFTTVADHAARESGFRAYPESDAGGILGG